MKKTGRKWKTAECGRCGEAHSGYSGKLDAEGTEYVVCGRTHKRMNITLHDRRDVMFGTVWEEES